MKKEEIMKELTDAGYKHAPVPPFESPSVEEFFQKRFLDENGRTNYFLNAKVYGPLTHPATGETFDPTAEYDIQMYAKGTHDPINMLYFAGWDLKSTEAFAKSLFDTGLFDGYDDGDKYDE